MAEDSENNTREQMGIDSLSFEERQDLLKKFQRKPNEEGDSIVKKKIEQLSTQERARNAEKIRK